MTREALAPISSYPERRCTSSFYRKQIPSPIDTSRSSRISYPYPGVVSGSISISTHAQADKHLNADGSVDERAVWLARSIKLHHFIFSGPLAMEPAAEWLMWRRSQTSRVSYGLSQCPWWVGWMTDLTYMTAW